MSKMWRHKSTPVQHLHDLERQHIRDRLSRPPRRRRVPRKKGGAK